MNRYTFLASVMAVVIGLAFVAQAKAWYRGGAYYRNPYTGRSAFGRTYYNPLTGGTYHGGVAYNPYTGREVAGRSYYNPYTNTYGRASAAYNPYTGRYAYRYGAVYP